MQNTTPYNYKKYLLEIPKDCYIPSEDTFLLLNLLEKEIVKEYNNVLEMGFGSGIISLYLYDYAKQIDCFDINPIAIKHLQKLKLKYDLTKMKIFFSNLFEKSNKKYDLIVFNPPYVSSKKIDLKDFEALATDGGKDGSETILKFIDQLNNYLAESGVCYLLISTLNKIENIRKVLQKKHLQLEIVSNKKLFFEELLILRISKSVI
jgi:HemK-related putative methylase